jgi:peptidoglycan/LPS O-acetylase OafA/YrhL
MIESKYRPDIDGLRAVAVLLVVLFHARWGFTGGFVGVDVFFVISGFLITGMMLKEQQSGTFRLADFWIRRVRRIIPASLVMVVAVLVAGAFLLLPHDYETLGESAISQQFMLANVYFWRNTGYFDAPAEQRRLLHTWSLAVEEQFYLGYPILFALVQRIPKKLTVLLLLAISAVSFAVSEWGVWHHPSATFFLLPTRAWELLMGGLLCFAPPPTRFKDWQLGLASLVGLGGIVVAGWFFSSSTPFPGRNALLPCAAAALLIYANSSRLTWIGRALAARPVVLVGLIYKKQ